MRNLLVVLGDQLDAGSAAFDGFEAARDAVWMAEVAGESEHAWSHKARIAVFLAAMRHFRGSLRARGITVHYRELEAPGNTGTLVGELARSLAELRPARVVRVEAGEWRVEAALQRCVQDAGIPEDVRPDRHFLCSREEFARHLRGRRQPRMEFFYREMRRRTGILMDKGRPVGGQWNFDASNRESFGRAGPGEVPPPRPFAPDAATREVLALVGRRFASHPGSLEGFDWPVTPAQAQEALDDFVRHRLPAFGRWQDAMWEGEPGLIDDGGGAFLYHSRLSCAMNLKLLDPRAVLAAVEAAWRARRVALPDAEGFIRQVLGWREYVRGIYWAYMPEYLERNALGAETPLPAFYWTGDTDMSCLRHALGQTLKRGYAHHIQRLMVTGLFALLLGVRPRELHLWYLAVYVDAVEWVELPNTLGMSQYADGGVMGSKPYVASGRYIQRMSDYCTRCRYDPARALGEGACPFTTLDWDFLLRHEPRLGANPRMRMQLRNLARLDAAARSAIAVEAAAIRRRHSPMPE